MDCTIFQNIFAKEPHYITVDKALARIKNGNSKPLVDEIRQQLSKERADKLKANLPSVCFSGKFSQRFDDKIIEHSGYLVLDFDEVEDLRDKQTDIISKDFVYACWISPRGNGLKALIKIADGKKHREHFNSLKDVFSEVDKSGVNESRVCFESYDPEIYINKTAKPYKKFKSYEKIQVTESLTVGSEVFLNIMKWLTNRGDAFVTGERNTFIFKLASACCRFGMTEDECLSECNTALPLASNSFSESECVRAIKSAYRANKAKYGTAAFDREILVDKVSRGEVKIDEAIFDESIRPKDVIFGEDVKDRALSLYLNGYEKLNGIGIQELDDHFKLKHGEITLLSGIGNYGKSSFLAWFLLMRIIKFDERFAFFSPENNPAEEFYHDFVEILLGQCCTPFNSQQPSQQVYEAAYDYISKRVFFVYPKDISPTPDYIKERFLELIIKEKVTGVIIDPFNQLANDYGKNARTDKYLETFLADCGRFAQINNIFFLIVAHPKMMRKEGDGNYPCPDLFDIADGAMWNNKIDNMLIYHRPNHQKDPNSPICEIHTKKIRRQKTVGRKGIVEFQYFRPNRRFFFNQRDNMQELLIEKGFDFVPPQRSPFNMSAPAQFSNKEPPVKNLKRIDLYEVDRDEIADKPF